MAKEKAQEEEGGGGKKKTGLIIIMFSVLLILAVVVVVFFIFPKFQQSNGKGDGTEQVEEAQKEDNAVQLGQIFKISGLTVNPKNTMGRRFAVFDVALEYQKPEIADKLKTMEPLIMDHFLKYLRNKTVTEFSQQDQMDKMREDLRKMVNDVLKEDAITHLYFTRYILE